MKLEKMSKTFQSGWNGGEGTVCGAGSSPEFVAGTFGPWLEEILDRYEIQSVADAGCGDFAWMDKVKGIGTEIPYLGYDVVARESWLEVPLLKTRASFLRASVTEYQLPWAVDLIICRDVFIHLPNDMICQALDLFRRSGSNYLLSEMTEEASNAGRKTVPEKKAERLRLDLEPFNLGEPIERKFQLGLWKLA